MKELKEYVSKKSTEYWNETADAGQKITKMLDSIVDFVVEYFFNSSNFPDGSTESKQIEMMKPFRNSMAMACVDVYSKAGAEGELSHSENSTSRSYSAVWISKELLSGLPNYVKAFY